MFRCWTSRWTTTYGQPPASRVITHASLEDVRQWVAPLHPRDISLGWCVKAGIKVPVAEADLQPGWRIVRVRLL